MLKVSLGESRVANLSVEEGECLLLTVVQGILLAVTQTIKELGILAAIDVSIATQVSNSEDLLNGILA